MKQSLSQKELLEKACANYQASVSSAQVYLEGRGITAQAARSARLGVVVNPEIGHEAYVGRLAIPYITKTGVVDIRFRALTPDQEPKYMGMPGVKTRLYNVLDVEKAKDWIAVCEGEIDALTLSRCVGIPCVGVAGATSWKPHYTRLLDDFGRVYVYADGDSAGLQFYKDLVKEGLPVTLVQMPEGQDVNSMYVSAGGTYLRERMGLNNE